jgi:hypothetical protein
VTVRPQAHPHLGALGMAFTDVAFLHWPYPPDQVEPLLPPDVWHNDTEGGLNLNMSKETVNGLAGVAWQARALSTQGRGLDPG